MPTTGSQPRERYVVTEAEEEEVASILTEARQRADAEGSAYVKGAHLDAEQLDRLAYATLALLRTRPASTSTTPGWTQIAASQLGVLPWWSELLGLDTHEERRQFRPLRTMMFDRLEELGHVSKPPGTVKSLHLAPEGEPFSHRMLVERVDALVRRVEALTIDAPAGPARHPARTGAARRAPRSRHGEVGRPDVRRPEQARPPRSDSRGRPAELAAWPAERGARASQSSARVFRLSGGRMRQSIRPYGVEEEVGQL